MSRTNSSETALVVAPVAGFPHLDVEPVCGLAPTRARRWCALALAAFGLWCPIGLSARAEEFKIENAVYLADEQEPTSRSTTYFTNDAVYDCMKVPEEIVIYERSDSRFTLVDTASRSRTHWIRTQLSTQDIEAFTKNLQQLAAKNPDPVIKFAALPTFQENFDAAANELTMSSPWLTYRLVLTPVESQETVERYREFCDWDARLNALLEPGKLPPFGRLNVNAAVAKHHAMPAQVVLTINSSKTNQPPTVIRSEHHFVRSLAPKDEECISPFRPAALTKIKLVRFDQYRKETKR